MWNKFFLLHVMLFTYNDQFNHSYPAFLHFTSMANHIQRNILDLFSWLEVRHHSIEIVLQSFDVFFIEMIAQLWMTLELLFAYIALMNVLLYFALFVIQKYFCTCPSLLKETLGTMHIKIPVGSHGKKIMIILWK